MAAVDANQIDDLEDGEIESDSEQQNDQVTEAATKPTEIIKEKNESILSSTSAIKKSIESENVKSADKKSEKKKPKDKEHSRKSEKDRKPHSEKPREHSSSPVEDDFARNIEKAIQKELKKGGDLSVDSGIIENDENIEDSEKKKHKKRKKQEYPEKERSSKRRKHDSNIEDDDMDEDELMFVRGASPVHKFKKSRHHNSRRSDEEYDSYHSDGSDGHNRDRIHNRMYRNRVGPRDVVHDHVRNRFKRRYEKHSGQDPDGVCLFYMQGKCYKGDDCVYSHDARPPRKMELCKFYLMDCCAKRDKCLYLHSDFPCKFYHTGLPCDYKEDCKFAHGKPLSENFKMILIKHIESAPKEILGNFPRLSRESAMMMITNTQKRLQKEFSDGLSPPNSSDELTLNKPMSMENANAQNDPYNRDKNKKNKTRQSRWCDPPTTNPLTQNILSVQNLCGVLTSQQISDLISMGIENIHQLTNLTVQQLNQLGMTANQINDIQLNTMNIQKLGLIENASSGQNQLLSKVKSKDLDMRISPALPDVSSKKDSELLGQDIDMRFQSNVANQSEGNKKNNHKMNSGYHSDPRKLKNSLDIDQYTKDALKFSSSEKDECSNTIMSPTETNEPGDIKRESDVDHRLLKYVQDATVANVKLDEEAIASNDNDADIAISSPQNHQQLYMRISKNEEKARRPTTDDEDDNLQIDEKWYSSDDDNPEKSSNKIKSPNPADKETIKSASSPQAIEPNIVIQNLGDLSKIDISDEVTKLLSSIKQSSDNTTSTTKKESNKSRDPRNAAKTLNENRDLSGDLSKKTTTKPEFVSIYNCSENSDPDARRRTDVDLRPTKDVDFRMPSFGDTDLRQTPGGADIDLRLGLHFKAMPNYTPATEIDGSIASHAPITYNVVLIDIPKPDYTDIKNSTPKSQASNDPRLRKIFRLSFDDSPAEPPPEKSSKSTAVRIDPRKRTPENNEKSNLPLKPPPLDLPTVIQTSEWYRDLSTNNKIEVNQQLASVSSSIKQFQLENAPGKNFDLSEIKSNNFLCNILNCLGIFLNEKGEYIKVNTQDNLISSPPMNFNSNSDMFMGGMMDNMNMMGMNNMSNVNMGNMNSMGNYNNRFHQLPDPRMQSNIPQNYDNYSGGSNFNPDSNNYNNYDNTVYNGPLNNENDYIDDNYDDNYYSDQNNDYRNNYRSGRNNDRWNRGRSRGGRDRRGYTERSHWNNDRN